MRPLVVASICSIPCALGSLFLAAQDRQVQAAPPVGTRLYESDLEVPNGWRIVITRAEQRPGGWVKWHYHNGQEVFLIEAGAAIFEVKGQPTKTLHAGEVIRMPPRVAHRVRNASDTEPYKLIAFSLDEIGKPQRVELEDDVASH